jgi:hypothetical protein
MTMIKIRRRMKMVYGTVECFARRANPVFTREKIRDSPERATKIVSVVALKTNSDRSARDMVPRRWFKSPTGNAERYATNRRTNKTKLIGGNPQ